MPELAMLLCRLDFHKWDQRYKRGRPIRRWSTCCRCGKKKRVAL